MEKSLPIVLLVMTIIMMGCESEHPDLKYLDPETSKRLAEQGDTKAQFFVAEALQRGDGVPVNEVEAVKWYKRAGNQNFESASSKYWYVQSLQQLGVIYYFGIGSVGQDFVESARWYRKAAELGDSSSQSRLSWMYQVGEGVPQDYMEAYVWQSVAVANPYWDEHSLAPELKSHNHEAIKEARDALAGKLSDEQLAAAQARATRLHEKIAPRFSEWFLQE